MIRYFLFVLFLSVEAYGGPSLKLRSYHPNYAELRVGDIVFQDTGGEQGIAIKAATGSSYTHCGVVFERGGRLCVLEAVQPVKVTELSLWKRRSKVFHARRLKDETKLDQKALNKAIFWGRKQLGKNYDVYFKWDDETLYCSELVWKIYQRSTGVLLCKPKTFQDYFLEDPKVRSLIEDRYGSVQRLPKMEPVVAPSDLASSKLLVEVPLRGRMEKRR